MVDVIEQNMVDLVKINRNLPKIDVMTMVMPRLSGSAGQNRARGSLGG